MPALDAVVTVRDIWQLALPEGTTCAGGSKALDNKVEWVSTLRGAFPLFGSMGVGYLAIARLELARGLDARITPEYLIRELSRVRAAGLVIDEAIDASASLSADEHALPIFCLPQDCDLHSIERAILRTIIDREGQISRREGEIRQRLVRAFESNGLPGLLTEASDGFGGEWLLCSADGACIASSGKPLVNDLHEHVYPITVAGRSLGRLLHHSFNRQPDLLEQLSARQTAEICGIALIELAAKREAEERFGTEFIEQLLDARVAESSLAARLNRLGLSTSPGNKYLVVALGAGSGQPSLACEEAARQLINAARKDGVQVLLTRFRQLILLLAAAGTGLSDRWARRWLQQGANVSASDCMAGVGRLLDDIAGLRLSAQQAIGAIELGQRIQAGESPFFYEEMGLYRLLADLRSSHEMDRFYEETLGALAAYDRQHHADLVHTLQVFFEHNANASQTSRALYVHRNTLNYRLQRIAEITGLDMEDPEARLAFQVALKIHKLST